jgi:hypothetical protein
MYQLMSEVESSQLYKERQDTPTFTSWVNALAEDLGVHVSLLWSRKKAGKSYDEYKQRAEKKGRKVADLGDLSVSPDSINLCEKVAGKNATEMDRLIEQVVAGKLTREDLRAAAKARKEISGLKGPRSRHDRVTAADRTETEASVTASDIVMALKKSTWLMVAKGDERFNHVYQCFPEFRIDTGTSRHSRRIDALIAETVTSTEKDSVVLRGVEIKVDKNDLKGDHKMAEYTDFCDYFYVAIPADNQSLQETAESIIRPTWGIITVSKNGKIDVIKEARKREAPFRDRTLATCLVKLMPHAG